MILSPINLISTDERGVAYIAGTKVKVRQIVVEKKYWGLSPEEIQEGHEHLSLAQIYAALSFYYESASKIDQEIEASGREVARLRSARPNLRTREQLEKRQHTS